MPNTPIDRQKHVEPGIFRKQEQLTILFASKSCLWNGHALMAREPVLDLSRNTLVNKDPHLSSGEDKLLALLKSRHSHVARDGWEIVQEIVKAVPAAFEIIEQCLKGHPCTTEHGLAAKDIGIPYDNGFRHSTSVAHWREGQK